MINIIFLILYIAVILLHVYFMVLEMVLWKKRAPKVFGVSPEFAEKSAALASNQGLYNGFLVLALIIGLCSYNEAISHAFIIFGLGCVIVAGIWGGITVNRRIAVVQALPAALALVLYLL